MTRNAQNTTPGRQENKFQRKKFFICPLIHLKKSSNYLEAKIERFIYFSRTLELNV